MEEQKGAQARASFSCYLLLMQCYIHCLSKVLRRSLDTAPFYSAHRSIARNNVQHGCTFFIPFTALQPIPWRAMSTCKPIWALTIASLGHGYGFTVVLSFMPTYLKTMQGYHIKQVSYRDTRCWRVVFDVSRASITLNGSSIPTPAYSYTANHLDLCGLDPALFHPMLLRTLINRAYIDPKFGKRAFYLRRFDRYEMYRV